MNSYVLPCAAALIQPMRNRVWRIRGSTRVSCHQVADSLVHFEKRAVGDLLALLKREYSLLYMAPGPDVSVWPYEAPFRFVAEGREGVPTLFRAPVTLDVERHMREAGVLPKDARREPSDSVGTSSRFWRTCTAMWRRRWKRKTRRRSGSGADASEHSAGSMPCAGCPTSWRAREKNLPTSSAAASTPRFPVGRRGVGGSCRRREGAGRVRNIKRGCTMTFAVILVVTAAATLALRNPIRSGRCCSTPWP